LHDRQKRGGLQAHGSGEPQVMFSHAKSLRWCDKNTGPPTDFEGDGFRR
jgi:hypothetical protein